MEHNKNYEGEHLTSEFRESGCIDNHLFLVCSCGAYEDKGLIKK